MFSSRAFASSAAQCAVLLIGWLAQTSIANGADRESHGIAGYWLGTLEAGPQKLRIQLNIAKSADSYECTLDSLDQQAFGIPCVNLSFDNPKVAFEVPAVRGNWNGELASDGNTLAGTWSQGTSLPLSLTRQSSLIAAPARPEPKLMPAKAPVKASDMQRVLAEDFKQSLENGKLASRTGVGVAIGVIGDGASHVFAFGAAKPDSWFEIGSITKTFTGLALSQMIEQKQVRADQPVRELLPRGAIAKSAGSEITLLDLVTQHSGLARLPTNLAPTNMQNPYVDYRADNLYAYLTAHGLGKPIKTTFAYSNLGFGLLGQALSNEMQVGYAQLVGQLVTEPLCMAETLVEPSAELKSRFIGGLQSNYSPASTWEFDAMAGAGALRSTAADMLKYLAAQLRPEQTCKSASPNTKTLSAALKRSQTLQAGAGPGMKIAYGWLYVEQTQTYWHNGGTGGYSSFAFFNPTSGTAAVVLTNLAIDQNGSFADLIGKHIGQRLAGTPAIGIP